MRKSFTAAFVFTASIAAWKLCFNTEAGPVIARQNIPAGTIINLMDVYKGRPGKFANQNSLGSPLPAIGRRAKRNIKAGSLLYIEDVYWGPRENSGAGKTELLIAKAIYFSESDKEQEAYFQKASLTDYDPKTR